MANEKRLIDANALIASLRESLDELRRIGDGLSHHEDKQICNGQICTFLEAIMRVREQPTVDAVEVVHGRWEDMWGGKYANPRYRCSVCKEKALYKSERDLLGNWKDVQALTPNCPYCMAKLDGGTENDI